MNDLPASDPTPSAPRPAEEVEPAPRPNVDAEVCAARRRRVVSELFDLGLLDTVGRHWVDTPDRASFSQR